MKTHRPWIAAAGFVLLVLSSTHGIGEEPIKARVWVNQELSWDAEILGRFGRDKIRIRKQGEQGEINIPAADLFRIDFAVKVDRYTVLELYMNEKFTESRDLLHKVLTPYLVYADVPSNLWWLFQVYCKALYWSGEHERLEQLASRLLENAATSAMEKEATLYRILALLAIDRIDEAETLLSSVKPSGPNPWQSAQYHYTSARVHLAKERLAEAQEDIATVIAFHAKDYEWMPAALYLSAQGYADAGNIQVARQIVEEIGTAYPRTRWKTRAESLLSSLEQISPQEDEPAN